MSSRNSFRGASPGLGLGRAVPRTSSANLGRSGLTPAVSHEAHAMYQLGGDELGGDNNNVSSGPQEHDAGGEEFMEAMNRLLNEDVNEDSGLEDRGESSGNESDEYATCHYEGAGHRIANAFHLADMDYNSAEDEDEDEDQDDDEDEEEEDEDEDQGGSWMDLAAHRVRHRQGIHLEAAHGLLARRGAGAPEDEEDADDEGDDLCEAGCHEIESEDGEEYIPDLLHERGHEDDVVDYISEEEAEFDEDGEYLSPGASGDEEDPRRGMLGEEEGLDMDDGCNHFLTAPMPSAHRTLSAFEEPWRSSPFYRHMAHSYGARMLPVLPGEVLPYRMQRDLLGSHSRHLLPPRHLLNAVGHDLGEGAGDEGASDGEDAAPAPALHGKRRGYGAAALAGVAAHGAGAGALLGAGLGAPGLGRGLSGMYGGACFAGKPLGGEMREIIKDRDFINSALASLPGVTPSDPRIQCVLTMLRREPLYGQPTGKAPLLDLGGDLGEIDGIEMGLGQLDLDPQIDLLLSGKTRAGSGRGGSGGGGVSPHHSVC